MAGDGSYAVLPLLPLCMLASALSLVLRYRRSKGEERQQIKWIAFAASVVVVVYAIAMIASFIPHRMPGPPRVRCGG